MKELVPRMGHREGDECQPVEVDHVLRVFDRCGGGEPSPVGCKVESVVKTWGEKTLEPFKSLVEGHKAEILKEYGPDVLSGKLVKDPPIRGPYGEDCGAARKHSSETTWITIDGRAGEGGHQDCGRIFRTRVARTLVIGVAKYRVRRPFEGGGGLADGG